MVKQGVVKNLNKYQEAIECYDKSIAINPKNDITLSNKGFALILSLNNIQLHHQKKYTDAISFYDKALSIKVTPQRLKLKADSLKLLNNIFKIFELEKISEAKKNYLASLEQGSNDQNCKMKQLLKI